ncbi:MAG: PAS domain S-box protein, partial [Dehalococcoidia bacterium]|nr:PAS domain S-box protein [Dehalococcoidia bacterium]
MKRNLQKYSQILENLHEGIWIIDEDANTILVNSRMAEMLGYTVDEMLGKPIFSFLDEYDTVIATRALERRKQGIREQLEHQLLCRDGTLIHTLFEASPMYDDEGNYAGSIAGVVDITERKQLEKALRESEERYQELADFLPQTVFEF